MFPIYIFPRQILFCKQKQKQTKKTLRFKQKFLWIWHHQYALSYSLCYSRNASCTLIWYIYMFLLLYFCRSTISPWGYHTTSYQCLSIDMDFWIYMCIYYWNFQFLNAVINIKTKVLLPQYVHSYVAYNVKLYTKEKVKHPNVFLKW